MGDGTDGVQAQLIDGRFQAQQPLGGGGFGAVYRARDAQTGSTVALKFLANMTADAAERFGRESRILGGLADNPCVVKQIYSNMAYVPPYIAMEYCELGSLRNWVTNRQHWKVVVGALTYCAVGLAGIHKAGGFHRDLKPENLLMTKHPTQVGGTLIKVADFGLARVPATDGVMTRTGAGTPGYIAPEVLVGGEYHQSADLYSLGIVAVELLTGARDERGLAQVDIPANLRALVGRLLARDPDARPKVAEVVKTLLALLKEQPSPDLRPVPVQRPHVAAQAAAVAVVPAAAVAAAAVAPVILGALLVGGLIALAAAIVGEGGGTGGAAGGGGAGGG